MHGIASPANTDGDDAGRHVNSWRTARPWTACLTVAPGNDMTSRYSLTSPIEELRTAFRFDGGVPFPPRFNIAPTQPVAIIRLRPGVEARGARELALVRWGLIPHWVKDPGDFATLVTARAETVLEKPSFKTPMRHRRCIVPADAYYEWTGKPGAKTPHVIRPKPGGPMAPPMALAALWEHWLGRDGSEMETMALVTVAANAQVAVVDHWLDVRGTNEVAAAPLLRPFAGDVLEMFEVDPAVNNPRADGPELQTPVTPR
jgi:putative SOS response-associated peptidase YedK